MIFACPCQSAYMIFSIGLLNLRAVGSGWQLGGGSEGTLWTWFTSVTQSGRSYQGLNKLEQKKWGLDES
jgi:hypothetical protein